MPYLGVRPADITSATEAEIAGDLTVYTNTLKVDATNNRVGVGTASPGHPLAITSSGATSTFSVNPSSGLTVIGTSQSSATNSDLYIDTKGTGSHIFRYNAGGAEIARFTSSGLAIGGTGAANTLDDYEEGTFTPTLSSSYYSGTLTINGYYTKIGNQVFVAVGAKASTSISLTTAGSSYISGLPFTMDVSQTNQLYSASWCNGHTGGAFQNGLGAYGNMYSGQTISMGANQPVVVTMTYFTTA